MVDHLEKELKQTKPFDSDEEAVALSVVVTAEHIRMQVGEVFKTRDLTPTQYNVLRILRGAGSTGLSCREIGERMITRDSDITRMLDRLEAMGLILRERQRDDRRIVLTSISEKGRDLLKDLDEPVRGCYKQMLSHLSGQDLQTLGRLLKKVRETAD